MSPEPNPSSFSFCGFAHKRAGQDLWVDSKPALLNYLLGMLLESGQWLRQGEKEGGRKLYSLQQFSSALQTLLRKRNVSGRRHPTAAWRAD